MRTLDLADINIRIPEEPLPNGVSVLFKNVELAGCKYYKYDLYRIEYCFEKGLLAAFEPSNDFDKNAIVLYVCDEGEFYKIGYIPAVIALHISLLDENVKNNLYIRPKRLIASYPERYKDKILCEVDILQARNPSETLSFNKIGNTAPEKFSRSYNSRPKAKHDSIKRNWITLLMGNPQLVEKCDIFNEFTLEDWYTLTNGVPTVLNYRKFYEKLTSEQLYKVFVNLGDEVAPSLSTSSIKEMFDSTKFYTDFTIEQWVKVFQTIGLASKIKGIEPATSRELWNSFSPKQIDELLGTDINFSEFCPNRDALVRYINRHVYSYFLGSTIPAKFFANLDESDWKLILSNEKTDYRVRRRIYEIQMELTGSSMIPERKTREPFYEKHTFACVLLSLVVAIIISFIIIIIGVESKIKFLENIGISLSGFFGVVLIFTILFCFGGSEGRDYHHDDYYFRDY